MCLRAFVPLRPWGSALPPAPKASGAGSEPARRGRSGCEGRRRCGPGAVEGCGCAEQTRAGHATPRLRLVALGPGTRESLGDLSAMVESLQVARLGNAGFMLKELSQGQAQRDRLLEQNLVFSSLILCQSKVGCGRGSS